MTGSTMAGRLHGELEGPQPLRFPDGIVALSGWCLLEDAPAPPDMRLVAAETVLPQTGRTNRTDVPARFPGQPAAPGCGFKIAGRLPAGIHLARLEARVAGDTWMLWRELSISSGPFRFTAVIDDPIFTGTLCDRIKVGGWALHPGTEVKELSLRYGHREVPCDLGRPRKDVPRLHPSTPQASRSGFLTHDFLVAGHGTVRARAKLADGRTVTAPTGVSFSILRDEFHGPELNLAAPRPALGERKARPDRPRSQSGASGQNILFVLPGSFASNSALHVAALANELALTGHRCAVAVAHDPETLAHLDHPAFTGLTHAAAAENVAFADGRGPDVIHAWTTRENVRRLAGQLRARHASRLIVHLEDNEQQVLALSLGRSPAEIEQLPAAELDRLVPADLSHPRRSREFLAAADGVTVIMDRLREFVPAGKICATLTPAADERSFYPQPVPASFRDALQLPPDTTVLFYHGNVHASNAGEVRELYAAVRELNRTGASTVLVRTGLDRVDFLGDLAAAVAPFVLSLGQILHHGHLPSLMALADIFVQPGGPDPFNDFRFPSKLPEFFALGRPVILPRTNLGTALRHGTDAWVLDRADAAGIAGAVRALRADPALREKLSRGATAYAAEHFSWRRSAAALAKFYRAVATS